MQIPRPAPFTIVNILFFCIYLFHFDDLKLVDGLKKAQKIVKINQGRLHFLLSIDLCIDSSESANSWVVLRITTYLYYEEG